MREKKYKFILRKRELKYQKSPSSKKFEKFHFTRFQFIFTVQASQEHLTLSH